ncbi:MAG TPA: pilus assembly protein PilM [Vicinamibacterales bacterium]|nr:pilus assembly protein PilM [Vicinamibacterales bacterium]
MSLRDLFQMPAPDVAVEIDHTHVAAAKLGWRGGQAVIAAHASEAVPAGLINPGLASLNVSDVPALSKVIARVLDQIGGRASQVSLVVPDTVAKVSLLKLEKVPARSADLQELVRWQIRKTAPFPIDQAVLSIAPGASAADGSSEFVVALSRGDVIHQYEQACLMAGAHAGLVDLSTFSVLNGVLAGASAPAGDWLLVHVTDTYLTLAVMRDRALLFFRNRGEEAEGSLADLIHQTAMYYEDRLSGGGFARVLIAGGARLPGGSESVRRGLEERLGVSVDAVDPRAAAALQDRIGASPELLDVLAPLVGILMRERKAA